MQELYFMQENNNWSPGSAAIKDCSPHAAARGRVAKREATARGHTSQTASIANSSLFPPCGDHNDWQNKNNIKRNFTVKTQKKTHVITQPKDTRKGPVACHHKTLQT